MASVQMQAYKVSQVQFINKVQGKQQLKFSNKVSYNVRYSNKQFCEGTLTVEVLDKENPDTINVKVTLVGAFRILKDVEKEFLHVETFKELFPLAKAFVLTLSTNAGIPPIYLQNVNIENQEIYRMEMGGNN
ncbi:MAG: protein-export chaperone SecB [Clostridia bacterium]|nr:protein-export chaperone SecB [Clostridia bacterium]